MKKFLIAACCVSLLSGVTVASAQTHTLRSQQSIRSSDATDISAAKKKKMKKGGMMKGDSMQGGGMQGGGMQGGGMGQGNMQKKGGM